MDVHHRVPRIRDLETDHNELAQVIGNDGELVLIHEPMDFQSPERTIEGARFVSCCMVIDAPKQTTKEFVRDFENYESFMEHMYESNIVDSNPDSTSVQFDVGLETPIINPHFSYIVKYDHTGEDLRFQSVSGDMDLILGRWEFIELSEDRTLLVYTSWFEFGSLSWALRTVLWAQPDLKLIIPVTQATVLSHALKTALEGNSDKPPETNASTLPDKPSVPLFTESDTDLSSLTPLAENGTLMQVHPEQWIQDDEDKLNIRFVTGIGLMNVDLKEARRTSTDFESYPNYIQQVSSVETERTDDGQLLAKWTLDLGVTLVSMGVSYTIKYSSSNQTVMTFERVEGDLEHIYGALEWEPVSEDRTLFFYTTATQIGSGDALIARLVNVLPYKQILIGVAAGTVAVEKLVRTVNQSLP